MQQARTYTANTDSASYSRWDDYKMLMKVKLSSVVVITSVLAYLVVAGAKANLVAIMLLSVGGFLVTAAANAINQVLEKDFDKLMTRTANRPVTSGRMKPSEAVLFAGISCLIGIIMLSVFNPITAFLGMLSFVMYSFLYTPLKRYSTIAVAVGAIPGALPVLIGCTAFQGQITILAMSLFMIQFLWQFPHFWAIGFLAYEDYSKAGYKLLPEEDGEIDRSLGQNSVLYTLLIIPIVAVLAYFALASLMATAIALGATIIYTFYGIKFHLGFDRATARGLMFCSFFYMPIVLMGYLIF